MKVDPTAPVEVQQAQALHPLFVQILAPFQPKRNPEAVARAVRQSFLDNSQAVRSLEPGEVNIEEDPSDRTLYCSIHGRGPVSAGRCSECEKEAKQKP